MDKKDVPQDHSSTYEGQNKLIYAVNSDGSYVGVKSSGWEIESFATELAVDELKAQTKAAYEQAVKNKVSPLAYHMANLRFDLVSLAQSTGFFQWQIKRHLKPKIFKKLSQKKLQRYANVMKIKIEQLQTVPDNENASEKV